MAGGDMADLMADHGGQFAFRLNEIEHAASHVNVTAGSRKCSHFRGVEHLARVFDFRTAGFVGQPLGDAVDVSP